MKYFDYKDVNLIPKKGIVKSRNECDTSVILGKHKFNLPVYPANMESIINTEIAHKLATQGYFYTMHRFMSNLEQMAFVQHMKKHKLISSISIGVNKESYTLLEDLLKNNLEPDFITIDIAHGYCVLMEDMLQFIRMKGFRSFIIAGNIATVEAANDLTVWGANAVKVGIAGGAVCTTAMATSFGTRGIQASIIKEISDNLQFDSKIIADGGIREHGDIAVALTMGAHMVMAGKMFSGFEESPGNLVDSSDNQVYKEYWGSASSHQSGKTNRIEGTKTLIPYKNRSILTEFTSLTESLQSAISYAGGKDLSVFINTEYIITK